jgi:hypothetical protein
MILGTWKNKLSAKENQQERGIFFFSCFVFSLELLQFDCCLLEVNKATGWASLTRDASPG